MRILHTADWHLGKNLEGCSRMDEQDAFLNDFVEIVKSNDIDLIIIAGDIYDNANPPARAERMFYNTLKKLSAKGERLTLVISGNHDNPDRLIAAGPLARDHGIIMVGTPKSVVPTGEYGSHKVVNSGEGFIEVGIKGERAVILTVPYPSEKRLNEVLYGAMDEEKEKLDSYSDRVKTLFESLSENYREDTVNIAVSHLFAMGSEEAGSERSIQLGGSFIVDGSCFPEKAQYIALGHVHKPQIVPGTDRRARYAGSPIHYNKKEINFTKKCFIIDVKAGENCHIEEIEFKVYKPIELWKCKSIEEAIEKCIENKDRNCWVYLEITTDRYIREDEIKLMKNNKKDILEIMPKILEGNNDELNINSFSEKSFEDIFREFYFKERKVEPQPEVVDLLLSIIREGEEENETN
ncbi:nuclease SbcCD subunit D [Clostridium pasteurianum DSM 525 = ATCC 6013]|uniref:Nuclease SbcCD subunit D n=1 Tax=Clostridium pasteurianum DSM 525 = ATCC 6013 TaxID=1262449 RepID=A0A0H3J758_CLOPA|nr:exonuclease SbcCD subunit D [Clostridium pasteurianum]AJA49047.1 nuclease SbcCD subunit D [Clostridium pasteurianum DSM 525 = ATCC 6013]AJA53035.1 nuclease SbcCD subunit D [Clostridium pasteurianum DSM 525 = ATCC 6013]AOZ76251.1 DNA exonuclease SbcCD subunit SbcD [Clostridium pasteurianum DSM 525 = ATCC 6013]AOZ80047.1 DNA exonuclease SbcCD subunit SbcD [Clostridium pasteurianum]ELP58985.1 exonuclease SbcD [Clostridium pasteurianum DSM 525 = ATCC 6013]